MLESLIKREGDGGRRGVTVLLQIVKDFGPGDVQHINGRIDDANVGLVGNVEVHIVGFEAGKVQHIGNRVAKDSHGPSENGPAIHVHIVHSLGKEFRGGGQTAATGRPIEKVASPSIGSKAKGDKAFLVRSSGDDKGARTVTKQGISFDVHGVDYA